MTGRQLWAAIRAEHPTAVRDGVHVAGTDEGAIIKTWPVAYGAQPDEAVLAGWTVTAKRHAKIKALRAEGQRRWALGDEQTLAADRSREIAMLIYRGIRRMAVLTGNQDDAVLLSLHSSLKALLAEEAIREDIQQAVDPDTVEVENSTHWDT